MIDQQDNQVINVFCFGYRLKMLMATRIKKMSEDQLK